MSNVIPFNRLLTGDCLEVLRGLPSDSVDAVVTDPPYGLSKEPNAAEVLTKWLAGEPYDHSGGGFMGKAWDSFVPHPDVWREVYRVLKPGGYALVFAGTRTQDLMSISLRLAGFEVRDVIEWLYFSGFPKSMNVGKQFDKRETYEPSPHIQRSADICARLKFELERSGRKRSEIDEHFGTNNISQYWFSPHRSPNVPMWEQWLFLRGFLGIEDESLDGEIWAVNEVKGTLGTWETGEKVGERMINGAEGTAGGYKNGIATLRGLSSIERVIDITAPSSPLAKQWDGWGTALKPAHEPIIVVRKPLIGTVADNVEKHGTGALNIDGCRIAFADDADKARTAGNGNSDPSIMGGRNTYGFKDYAQLHKRSDGNESGRFPANCVTTDDDAFYSPYFNVSPPQLSKKASVKDRNARWDGEQIDTEPKVSGMSNGAQNNGTGGQGLGLNRRVERKNFHPTVKPVELMSWLVRLVTPPGGVVLDPFAGSGTTLVAAKREGFQYIGIEREAEYVGIAEARLAE